MAEFDTSLFKNQHAGIRYKKRLADASRSEALAPVNREPLDRARIAAAALGIIDWEGLVGLSMRRLGAELGVEGMALYRHYPQKEAILDQVVELVLSDLKYPEAERGRWQEHLRLVSRGLRERVLAHPNAMPLVAARWLSTSALAGVWTQAIAEMQSSSVSPADAHALVRAVMSFVLGYCWIEVGAFVGDMPDEGGLTRKPISIEESQAWSGFSQEEPRSQQFEKGLDFLLSGAGAVGAIGSWGRSDLPQISNQPTQ